MRQFVLEDYEATQQSLSRLHASIAGTRNWMVASVMTYFAIVSRLPEMASGGTPLASPERYLWPPLFLWLLSYIFTAYERGNAQALVEIVRLVERAHLAENRGEYDELVEKYVPMSIRLKTLEWWRRIPAFYLPALADVSVGWWHSLLLLFILGSGWALYPSHFCPIQCPWQWGGLGLSAALIPVSLVVRCLCMWPAQDKLLSRVERAQRLREAQRRKSHRTPS